MSLRRLGLYCGVVSPVLWLSLIAFAAATRPDFSPITHYISELAERGSTTEVLMRYGAFVFTGFLYLCFAGALFSTVRHGWLHTAATLLIVLDGLGRMGAGAFPCDPGCIPVEAGADLHKTFATIGFCSGTLAAFVWAPLWRRIPTLESLTGFSVASGAIALVSLLILTRSDTLALPAGLFEHLATVVLSVWLCVFAWRLLLGESTAQGA